MTSMDRTPVAQELHRETSSYQSGKHTTTQVGMKYIEVVREETELQSYVLCFINAFFYSNAELYKFVYYL
jgi:hypothetical protein